MEIYKGSSETVYFRNYVNGTLTTVSGTVELSIKGPDGEELDTPAVATGATGVYSATIPSSLTIEEADLYADWTATNIEVTQLYKVVTPYIETYDLINLSPSGKTWDELKYAETYARHKINAFTMQTFGKISKTINTKGSGTDILILDERILSVEAVYQNRELVIDLEEDTNTFGHPIKITPTNRAIRLDEEYDISEYRQAGISSRGGAFKESWDYDIQGVFGWAAVPSEIQSCAKELAGDYWCNDNKWRESYVESIKNESYSMKFDKEVFSGTGNSYVDAILEDFLITRSVIL